MRISVPKEIKSGEKRVALVPDIISKLTKAGLEVVLNQVLARLLSTQINNLVMLGRRLNQVRY